MASESVDKPRTRRGGGCLLVALFVAGLCAGMALMTWGDRLEAKAKLAHRLDDGSPIRPLALRDPKVCKPATAAQLGLDDAMRRTAGAMGKFKGAAETARHYVASYFAWHYSITGPFRRCPPSDAVINEVGPLLVAAGYPAVNEQFNDLRLVERLPPGPQLAERLAQIGFLGWIPPSDLGGEDSRPYARLLLGEQGAFARPWADRALAEIDGDTRLGTSAAFLAVATAPDRALPLVEEAMTLQLAKARARKVSGYAEGGDIRVLRSRDGDRLIELGYALGKGGMKAQRYAAPLVAMLDDRIGRSAPPFGLMAAPPTELCRIASQIGGTIEAKAKAQPYCAPGFKGGDGSPRQW